MIERHSLSTAPWQKLADIPGPGTQSVAAYATISDSVYLLGGEDESPHLPIARVIRYDITADSWSIRSPLPSPRKSSVAVENSGIVYVLGGCGLGGSYLDQIVAYNPATDSQCVMATKLPVGMCAFVAVPVGSKVYLMGGAASIGNLSSTYEGSFSQ